MIDLRRQQGVALLVVLILVALAAVLSANILFAQHRDLRRAENQTLIMQARQYAWGAEAWAIALLADDARRNKTDSQHDAWAKGLIGLPIDGGTLSGRLVDMQSRLNLNSVSLGNKRNQRSVQRLKNLMTAHALDADVTDALADWIDGDTLVTGWRGAEDDYYSRLQPGYRSANHLVLDVSEILNIRGMDRDYLDKLSPYLAALPTGAAININTALPPVLSALGLNDAQVQAIIARRKRKPFNRVSEMLQLPELSETHLDAHGLSVASRYFVLELEVQLDRVRYRQRSLIERKGAGGVKVLWRHRGEA